MELQGVDSMPNVAVAVGRSSSRKIIRLVQMLCLRDS
jgi:hypothetical protein